MASEHATTSPGTTWGIANEADWDRVYAEQLPRIYNFFRFRMPSAADAEDLTARTFEKAWRSRERYRRDVAAFSTWLFSIARNVAIDHLRTSREHLPIEAADAVALEATPESEVSRGSDVARLTALTADLPEREREILALKYGATMTNRAIADLTGLSESNVGTIVSRVVVKLRSRW